MSRQDRFLRSNAQQKERAWERRRTCFAAALEEIRPDGEFPDRQDNASYSNPAGGQSFEMGASMPPTT